MFLRLHTANELPGDAGAAGRGLPIKGKVLQGFVRGLWAGLPSLQTTVLSLGTVEWKGPWYRVRKPGYESSLPPPIDGFLA